MMHCFRCDILERFRQRFTRLYGTEAADRLLERLKLLLCRYQEETAEFNLPDVLWDEHDVVLITYGDMVRQSFEAPLKTLHRFLNEHLREAVNTVHILPFFPYSSDWGFSIIDYRQVDPELGTWEDVDGLARDYYLMFDLVLNHVSRRSTWFHDYVAGVLPACDFFIHVRPGTDLSDVVRPRSKPLLSATHTRAGTQHVWTTFSDDQIDLNFANPDVLFEFLDLLLLYIERGARIIRLDAIAYLWKKIGTSCIHLPETHEVVKLMRDLVDFVASNALILTETNVPHRENISYFGDQDEAHVIYQFSLPPLLLHALLTGNATHLRDWAGTVSCAPPGCTYLNFTASHDGIGVRPLEGVVPPDELDALCEHTRKRGGQVSTKTNSDGSESPYELNITYFDALVDPDNEDEDLQVAKFLCSQSVMLVLKGIPAVYFNSLFGGRNDLRGVEETGEPRAINRAKWDGVQLGERLATEGSPEQTVFARYVARLACRRNSAAFHPDGRQEVPDLGESVFAVKRTSPDGEQAMLCLHNLTPETAEVTVDRQMPRDVTIGDLTDAVTGEPCRIDGAAVRLAPFEALWLQVPAETAARP